MPKFKMLFIYYFGSKAQCCRHLFLYLNNFVGGIVYAKNELQREICSDEQRS